jgi:hypothetical protein
VLACFYKEKIMATACAKSNRWARGGIGALVGGLAGGLVGFGVFMVAGFSAVQSAESGSMPGTGTFMSVLAPVGGTLLGAGLGAWVGARKPQC